jgi:hypothetical protein
VNSKTHLNRVAGLGCIICSRLGYPDSPAEIHHIRAGTGMGRRASDYDTLPLCPEHHRGKTGVHGLGTKGFVKHWGVSEHELLADVKMLLGCDK